MQPPEKESLGGKNVNVKKNKLRNNKKLKKDKKEKKIKNINNESLEKIEKDILRLEKVIKGHHDLLIKQFSKPKCLNETNETLKKLKDKLNQKYEEMDILLK